MNYAAFLESDYQQREALADAHEAQVEALLNDEFAPFNFSNFEEAISDGALKFFQKPLMQAIAKADDAEMGRVIAQAVERYWLLRAEAEVERREASHV